MSVFTRRTNEHISPFGYKIGRVFNGFKNRPNVIWVVWVLLNKIIYKCILVFLIQFMMIGYKYFVTWDIIGIHNNSPCVHIKDTTLPKWLITKHQE